MEAADTGQSANENARLEEYKNRLASFVEGNPSAQIVEIDQVDEPANISILRPWGDTSLAFHFSPGDEKAIDALNSVKLPEQFSAIYHTEEKALEVIWTAYKLDEYSVELIDREFVFRRAGKSHKCHFTRSSDRLLEIARVTLPLSNPGDTNFRNLLSYNAFVHQDGESDVATDTPYSFWIHDLEFGEKETVDLVRDVNFYLTYFDRKSPLVLIHPPILKSAEITEVPRYPAGDFPKEINATELDPNLIQFWASARNEAPAMRYLMLYRIIEYSALEWLDQETKKTIRKILKSPDVGHNAEQYISEIVLNVLTAKAISHDAVRFRLFLENVIAPRTLWNAIEENRKTFQKAAVFDGGYTLDALIAEKDNLNTFSTGGVTRFADSIRKMRNALSHGRDSVSTGIISPTARNMQLLTPWVQLIEIAAGEVVLYKSIS